MVMKKIAFLIAFVCWFLISPAIAQDIKIVQFSDIHIDTKIPDKKNRKFAQSKYMFETAIQKVNEMEADIVVISGDMVNRPSSSEFDIFLNSISSLKHLYYPALGNHDVGVGGGLSKQEILSKLNAKRNDLNLKKPYYYLVKGDYIFIFMDGTTDKTITSNGYFSKENLLFLDKTLTNFSDKKAIIVQHFPLIEPIKSSSHAVLNRDEYFEVLDRHKNVIMLLSGHYHFTGKSIRNNVLHVSTPAMIQTPHAFRYIEVKDCGETLQINSQLYSFEGEPFKHFYSDFEEEIDNQLFFKESLKTVK